MFKPVLIFAVCPAIIVVGIIVMLNGNVSGSLIGSNPNAAATVPKVSTSNVTAAPADGLTLTRCTAVIGAAAVGAPHISTSPSNPDTSIVPAALISSGAGSVSIIT
jgi:hypothetical protein